MRELLDEHKRVSAWATLAQMNGKVNAQARSLNTTEKIQTAALQSAQSQNARVLFGIKESF